MNQLAIIGPTASGKTTLSIELAKKLDGYILSLDSLAIYKEIDIASAKPTAAEMGRVPHFGIDLLLPSASFDVSLYINLYKKVYKKTKEENKTLIIVGGSSFYLKMLMDGISKLPLITDHTKAQASYMMKDLDRTYRNLHDIDPKTMIKINSTDRYRIEKILLIWLATGMPPSIYFEKNPPIPAIKKDLPIYQIELDKNALKSNISLRTTEMINTGLIDEVSLLEKKYTRSPNCMKSIGIKETLEYLDGVYDIKSLKEKIDIHTIRLAKRQKTFNKYQFNDKFTGCADDICNTILDYHG